MPPSEFFGVFLAPVGLTAFLGPGTFGADFSTAAMVTAIGGRAVVVTGSSDGSAFIKLTYDFRSVPEPGAADSRRISLR